MHNFSTLNSQTHHHSFLGTHNQKDVHAGRLFCWSGALVTISIWAAIQFVDGQNRNWHRQHPQGMMARANDFSLPPTPEGARIWQRIYERQARLASLKQPKTR